MALLSMENNAECLCFGCGSRILDKFLLRVSPNLQWHVHCLKCSECGLQLDEKCTCFVRNGKPYCKPDYLRLFGNAKCCKCKQNLTKCDFVMRAQTKVFHVHCFRCDACDRHLMPGEHYALKDETLYCKSDYEQAVIELKPSVAVISSAANAENNLNKHNCRSSTPMAGFGGLVNDLMSNPDSFTVVKTELNISSNCSSVSPNSNSNSSSARTNFSNSDFGTSRLPLQNNDLNHCTSLHNSLTLLGHQSLDHLHSQGNPTNRSQSTLNSQQANHNSNNGSTASNQTLNNSHHSQQQHHHNQQQQVNQTANPNSRHSNGRNSDPHKPTRIRTVLNDKQLQTLRTCYNSNPRPDALMKDELVKLTGLNPRVIRVWFQNKRCKDKKKNILMKQLQQQERDGRQMQNIASMRGIPLMAMSPVPHDSPAQAYSADIQAYEPNWAKLSDYASQGPCDPADPHFQHLVSQMNGYDQTPPNGPSSLSLPNTLNLITDAPVCHSMMTDVNLMNGSNNSNGPSHIVLHGSNSLHAGSTAFLNELCRSESVLSALRPDTPSELSCASE